MSHGHFCDYAGHEWNAMGMVGDKEPSVCIYIMHEVPVTNGDHGDCPIEPLACAEHRDEQLRDMGTIGMSDMPES
jgi:hypothetical protein